MPNTPLVEVLAELRRQGDIQRQQGAMLDRLLRSLPLLAATAGDRELRGEQHLKARQRKASALKIVQRVRNDHRRS